MNGISRETRLDLAYRSTLSAIIDGMHTIKGKIRSNLLRLGEAVFSKPEP
jgi:hypothetical protein